MKKPENYTFSRVRIVMVNTTEAGNIGAAARAMKNMELESLYLVTPRDYPSAKATARASGADDVLAGAVVCESLEEALAGVHLVIGASARQRSIKWPQVDVIGACNAIGRAMVGGERDVAVVFGTENSGLTNEDLDKCQMLMTIPGNRDYFSLNVAAAVQVFAYQYFVLNDQQVLSESTNAAAGFNELEYFYEHLAQVLQHIEFFDEMRPQSLLMRRLRRFFVKARPEQDELAIFRGILHNIKPFSK